MDDWSIHQTLQHKTVLCDPCVRRNCYEKVLILKLFFLIENFSVDIDSPAAPLVFHMEPAEESYLL